MSARDTLAPGKAARREGQARVGVEQIADGCHCFHGDTKDLRGAELQIMGRGWRMVCACGGGRLREKVAGDGHGE